MALTITRTQGVSNVVGTTEVTLLTFQSLLAGETITIAGLTVTALVNASASAVAGAFAGSDSPGVLSKSGTMLPYNSAMGQSNELYLSGTTQGNLTDLVATGSGAGKVTIAVQTQGTDSIPAVTETTDVGFVDLAVGEQLTIGGLTATAIAPVTAANVAAAFANTTTGHATAALAFSGTLTGFTASAVSNVNHVIFTSTTPNTDVPDLLVNYVPVATSTVSNGNEDTVIPISLIAKDKDGSIVSFRMSENSSNGTLYADSALTQPFAVGSDIPATQIPNYSTVQIAALTSYQIAELTTTDIAAMSAVQAAALMPAQVMGLTSAQILVMPTYQITALTTTSLVVMTDQQLDLLSPTQVSALTANQYNALSAPQQTLLNNTWGQLTLPPNTPTTKVYFKPNANWNGTTTFSYAAVDNQSVESTVVTSTINVAPVADAPTVNSGSSLRDFYFTGHLNILTDSSSLLPGLSDTSTFTGHLIFDPTVTDSNNGADVGDYQQTNAATGLFIQFNGTGGQIYNFATNHIGVGSFLVETTNYLNIDNFTIHSYQNTLTNGTGQTVGSFPNINVDLQLDDLQGAAFSDTSLPITLNIADWENRAFSIFGNGTNSISLNGVIDSIVDNPPLMAVTVTEATTISSTGSFAISDVDFADLPDGDTVSVDILGVTVNSSNSLNDGTLAALLTYNLPQVLNFLELSPATLTANSNVNWSFNIANIPAFANLLTGESIHLSYQIEATDSNNLINTPPQTLNFTIQGQTQIISAVVIPADPDVPATIKIETENGTAIRLFEGITDVTDKFNQDFVVDTFSGIKTVTFTVKPNSGYNGDRSLVAKSFLIGDPNTVQSTSANLSLTLPDGDDNLVGTAGNDILFGGAGNDTLFGLDGNDSLDGGSGNDSLDGGFGNDSLDGGVGTDTLSGEAGDDEYFIHDAEDVIIEAAGQGIDTIHLTTSYNLLAIAQGGNYELPEIENIYLDGTANINASGNHGANAIYGNSGNNTLNDGNASDSTTPDTLSGGKGDDVYVIHNNATIVVGETNIGGVDTIQYWVNGLCVLPKNVENLILFGTYGSTPSCGGKGNNLANSITGSAGTDTLDGGAGADTLTGGAGDDTYIIDRATDIITENTDSGTDTVQSIVTYTLPTNVENLTLTGLAEISGTGNELNNTITGNNAANTLIGGLGADFLTGISGNDSLDGGAGSDTLIGGMGVDTLTGGTEADTFTFLTISEMGMATRRDVITDFTTGTDKIDLSAMNIVGSAGTGALVDMFKIRWTFYGGYAVVQGDTNEDPATIEFEIKLNGVTALADTDFIFAFGAPIHYGTIAAFLLDASSIPVGNSVTVDATGATQTQLDDLISYISKIAVDGITGTGLSVTDTQFAAIAPKLATSVNDVTVNAAAATSSELQALSINIDRVGSITNLTIDAASQTDTETANLLSKAASSVSIIATGATQTEVVSMTINASKIADSGITGSINLTAAQSQVLAANLATSATVTVTDTGVNIAASIANLVVNIVKIDNIDAIDNSLTLNTAQFNAIGDARLTTSDVITVSDSIANINTNLNTLVDSLKVDNIITSLVTIGETLNVLPADGTTVGSYSTTASANTAAVVTAGEWYFDSVTDVLTFWDATGASAKSITLTGANSIAADNSGVFTIS